MRLGAKVRGAFTWNQAAVKDEEGEVRAAGLGWG